ncbi:hypothetical protein EXIGLDRAFT_784094 [Exidia glandulosa HHB12029]|uniref:Uncharacterized protein n=1 Tax=Exidia glandulosa HHB12029 TaxID=1314781 RepID=A0A166MPI0_EXIGL|nr:hypothetical protein EXIGLDRAFT_784094 [Exidia glandulosa HHB12029]
MSRLKPPLAQISLTYYVSQHGTTPEFVYDLREYRLGHGEQCGVKRRLLSLSNSSNRGFSNSGSLSPPGVARSTYGAVYERTLSAVSVRMSHRPEKDVHSRVRTCQGLFHPYESRTSYDNLCVKRLGQPPLQRAERCLPLPAERCLPLPALGHSPQLDILLSKYEDPDEYERLPPHLLPLRVQKLPRVPLLDDSQPRRVTSSRSLPTCTSRGATPDRLTAGRLCRDATGDN